MIRCPYCEKSHYIENHRMMTALGWVQEYENGIPINSNPNTTTVYCTCCECQHDFHYWEQYNEIQGILDDGPTTKIPVIQAPINNKVKNTTVSMQDITIKSEMNTQGKLPIEDDIKSIKEELRELREKVNSLWEYNTHNVL